MLALYGFIFTVLDHGFIWFISIYFYFKFVAQNTIKKPASPSGTA